MLGGGGGNQVVIQDGTEMEKVQKYVSQQTKGRMCSTKTKRRKVKICKCCAYL